MDLGFNPQDVPDASLLPEGQYTVMLKGVELNHTKAGDGRYLRMAWEVHSPAGFKGAMVWENLNVDNPNSLAQDIGRREYKRTVAALGDPACSNPETLRGRFMMAELGIRKGRDGYDDENTVKKRSAVNASAAPAATQPAAPAAAAAPAQPAAPAAAPDVGGYSQPAAAPAAAPWAAQR